MELKLELSNFEEYLNKEYLIGRENKEEYLNHKIVERNKILLDFPYSVILKLFYQQIDFADWLLWQILGDKYGYCNQEQSDIPACKITGKHKHNGVWTSFWLAKTDYDYGFNEWFFKNKEDCNILISILSILRQMYCGSGTYNDKYFWVFLDDLSNKTISLSRQEKLKYFNNINWDSITDEILNETYNF